MNEKYLHLLTTAVYYDWLSCLSWVKENTKWLWCLKRYYAWLRAFDCYLAQRLINQINFYEQAKPNSNGNWEFQSTSSANLCPSSKARFFSKINSFNPLRFSLARKKLSNVVKLPFLNEKYLHLYKKSHLATGVLKNPAKVSLGFSRISQFGTE